MAHTSSAELVMAQGTDRHSTVEREKPAQSPRIADAALLDAAAAARLDSFCNLAVDGLVRMAQPDMHFPHTMRGIGARNGAGVRPEGDNLRYTVNVAQGLGWLPETVQRKVLGGHTAADLAEACIDRAAKSGEPGAVALAAWAAAETAGIFADRLFKMLGDLLEDDKAVETVPTAWALTATVAARHLGETKGVQQQALRRLMQAQGPSGLFRHVMPARSAGWARGHVGSFADQVYPIIALSRLHLSENTPGALRAAEACASNIVRLQGRAGQWWWHYDARNGSVVEGYPVYSVHQHAMGPMALLDLYDAGGTDHRDAVLQGFRWIDTPAETSDQMVSVEDGVIWRKVGRNEPPKLVRSLSAVTTALHGGWHLPGMDALFPPGRIDRECRPYEFGWMLYAWRSPGLKRILSEARPVGKQAGAVR